MEINADTTGANAASVLIDNLAPTSTGVATSSLPVDQQQAVTVAVQTLLTQAGISETDPVEVHFAASQEGRWAVLRVATVVKAAL